MKDTKTKNLKFAFEKYIFGFLFALVGGFLFPPFPSQAAWTPPTANLTAASG